MNKFNLTEIRIEKLIRLFERGHSITTAAIALDVHPDTLSRKCKEIDLNPRAIHQANLKVLQADLLYTINNELEPDDKVKHGLKYLERYQKDLDEPTTATVDVTVTIAADIMKELSGE